MKNIRIRLILIFTLLTGTLFLNSCLKDDVGEYWKDDLKGKMYATFLNPGVQSKSLLPLPDDVIISFDINIATDALPGSATTIKFKLDNDTIASYVAKTLATAKANKDTLDDGSYNYKDYKPFPSVQLLDPEITIPAGSRVGVVRIKVARADTVKMSGNYMVGLTITEAPAGVVIARNMKSILLALPIANQYEADYLSEGIRNHPVNGIEPFKYPKIHFSTINANTVRKDRTGNYTGYVLDITVSTETMVVKGVTVNKCTLVARDATTKVPIEMGVYDIDEDGNAMNYYNPITKVFELYYFYNKAAPRKIRETNSRL